VVRRASISAIKVWARVHAGPAKGLWLKVDPRQEKPFLEGYHELAIQNALQEVLREGDVFYDVGAHIGLLSLVAARLIGARGEIQAFEAAPENVAAIEQHVQRNRFPQIKVNPVAVWSTTGRVSFHRPFLGSLRGVVVSANNSTSDALDYDVEATTLDYFVKSHRLPNLIKVDVEGAEAEVLRGADKVFDRCRPILICEVHNQEAVTRVQEWLSTRGYTVKWMGEADTLPRHLVAKPSSSDQRTLTQVDGRAGSVV
jgi:FkbM family methyltransferase